jgi:uncharacterized protein (DUF58 family)
VIPTRRLVFASLVPLVLGVAAVVHDVFLAPMIAVDVVLLLVVLLDAAPPRPQVRVARAFDPVQAVGRPFDVALTLEGRGRVRVADQAPGESPGIPGELRLSGAPVTVRYPLRVASRGAHSFGLVTLRVRGRFGLTERQRRVEVPGVVRVYPDFRQLRHAGLRARQDERRAPVKVRRRPGGENEFERNRPYVRGDSFRHVDWRATARHRSLITREFGQESNQNVLLLLDAGRLMSATTTGGLTAFDHAMNAALLVGQAALRHGDRVGALAFDREVRAWLPPRGGSRSGARLIRGLYDVFPRLEEPDFALAFRHLGSRVRRRSLVVLFTTLQDEVSAGLATELVAGLARRHVPLCVLVRDPSVDALWKDPDVDPYTRGAAAEILGFRERSVQALVSRGALVVDASPEALSPELLAAYLEVKARRLL